MKRGPAWPHFDVAAPGFAAPRAAPSDLLITWIGHSTMLLQIGGCNVLTDPIWSERASPFRRLGPRRMTPPAIALDALPPIDLVAISHDHYDHLDDRTVRRLAERHPEARWIVPLRLAELVTSRGARNVEELDWWEARRLGELRIGCTPAQHFCARGLGDRNRRLWCGWTFAAREWRVFFAGDTALHPEFGAIADAFGPFDAALLPIGAYEPNWFMRSVHVNPEEAVRAYVDLTSASGRRCAMVPMHWGTFRLADEPPGEPPVRVRAAWAAAGLPDADLALLRHGETLALARDPARAPPP